MGTAMRVTASLCSRLASSPSTNPRGVSFRVSRPPFALLRRLTRTMPLDLPHAREFSSDRITLVGDLSAADVDRALSEGEFKSWIYMNAESDAAFPAAAKKALGDGFKQFVVEGATLTRVWRRSWRTPWRRYRDRRWCSARRQRERVWRIYCSRLASSDGRRRGRCNARERWT